MEKIYEVLARVKRDLPLHIVGTVSAPTNKLAAVYACKTFDEFNYIEMKVVPRENIIHVYSIPQIIRKGVTL
jgi:1,2-phenylacetyl-CoA epoxidase PaaB subunit